MGNNENNRDGANDNYSWNHGVEGPTSQHNIPEAQRIAIEQLRTRQVKNAFAMLFLSQGTPMMLSGDEFRQSAGGNNNYWSQEKLNLLDWSLLDKNADTVRFVEMMSGLRKEFQIGRRAPEDVTWHGTKPNEQSFQPDGRFIGWQLPPGHGQAKSLYSAFNAYWEPLEVTLPEGNWRRRVDTSLPAGQEVVGTGEGPVIEVRKYIVQPRTGVVFESAEKPATEQK
jgi:isoamylase